MELLVDDSPLAHYLEGQAEQASHTGHNEEGYRSRRQSSLFSSQSFAPQGRPSLLSRKSTETRVAAQQEQQDDLVTNLKSYYALAVSSTLGKEDNHRFLEHFRYIIIASQLLADTSSTSSNRLSSSFALPPAATSAIPSPSFGPGGILLAAVVASPILYVLRSVRNGWSSGFSWTAVVLLCSSVAIVGSLLYAYARRQMLKNLRKQAVTGVTAFVTAMQEYENTAVSLLTFIQEVELVSKGYRLSNPLPPVTRLEGSGQSRTCARMRRTLQSVYSTVSPNFISAAADLHEHVQSEDFDRFLEVYDVRHDDIEDAKIGFVDVAQEELETVRSLKLYQYRLTTLRRVLLCSCLSLPATGRQSDAGRWRIAVAVMEYLTQLLVDSNAILTKLLEDEKQIPTSARPARPLSLSSRPSSISSTTSGMPQAVRPISTLTTGVHSLSARLHLLRSSVVSTQLGDNRSSTADLQEQYDALGDDLKALMREWEQGREAISGDNVKQNRRISSMMGSSPNGLEVLHEDEDGEGSRDITAAQARARALRALTGEGIKRSSMPLPLHLPLTPPVSIVDGGSETSTPSEEREAVFEAVAVPRVRQRSSLSGMTREQRIAKMHEDQRKMAEVRRSRDVQGDMMSELRTVIGHRRPLSFKAQRESTRISSA